jgi:predicted transcriptional regulator
MIAKDLINYTIPPLKRTDTVAKAQQWMSEFHTSEFPVVDQGQYHGIFSEQLILDTPSYASKQIGDFDLFAPGISVSPDEHYYEILKKYYAENINLIAVIDSENQYQGVISIQDVVEAFAKMSSIRSPGTILVIPMKQIDYSLTEIARIVESEYGKILSSFIENHPEDPSMIRLTLKLNVENANGIIAALERFGFTISSIFGKEDEDLIEKERLDSLMKYLKI